MALPDGAGELQLVAGTFGQAEGPIQSLTGVFMSVVALRPGAVAELTAPPGRAVFLYVARGSCAISGVQIDKWQLARMNDDGDSIALAADPAEGAVLLFGHAEPIGEPVVARGPFVMNSEAEIRQAILDYQAGKFDGEGKLLDVGG